MMSHAHVISPGLRRPRLNGRKALRGVGGAPQASLFALLLKGIESTRSSPSMIRLGMDVALLAKLGVDARAETILQRLEKEGVSTVWVKRDPRLPTPPFS